MGAFALIHLIFIISFLTQFLFKRTRWCRHKLKTATSSCCCFSQCQGCGNNNSEAVDFWSSTARDAVAGCFDIPHLSKGAPVILRAVHGGAFVPVIIAAQSFFQIFQVASNYWMAWASPPTSATTPTVGLGLLFSVYIALSMGSALCIFARSMLVSLIGLLTSEKFFKNMLHCIMRAPMSFFDSTPTGRILNRASNDQSVLDLEIASKLGWCVFSVIQILGTVGVMSQVAWPVFAIFVPVTVVCFLCQRYYIPTARELARLSQIQRAPILGLVDNHSRPWFHNISSMEWLSFRLNMLSNFVFAFSLTLLVSLRTGGASGQAFHRSGGAPSPAGGVRPES